MNTETPNEKHSSAFESNGPSTWEIPKRTFEENLSVLHMTDFVHNLAPWRVFATHTFTWEASFWSATKSYRRFMNRSCPAVSYFYALEKNKGRDGFHVHALWADCEGVQRSEIWKRWFATYGRNRIEPVRGISDVARYCTKYVCKEGVWWDVKIVSPDLWHAIHEGKQKKG